MNNQEDFPIIARYQNNDMSLQLPWKPLLKIYANCEGKVSQVSSMDKIVTDQPIMILGFSKLSTYP